MFAKKSVFCSLWERIPTPLNREEVISLLNDINNERGLLSSSEVVVLCLSLKLYALSRSIDVFDVDFV